MRVTQRRSTTRFALACGLLGVVLAAGCQTEETLKKANGYYQEGLANLDTDQRQAFVSFQKAIQLNPRHKNAHYSLAHLYTKQGKFQQAEQELREVLAIDPEYSEAHNYLGQVLEAQGRWREAVEEYRQALRNPLYATPDIALYRLGRALAHEGDLEGAMQALEDALRVNPPSQPLGPVQLELGRVYLRLGYDVKAREALTEAAKLDKGSANARAAEELLGRLKR